MDHNGDGGGGSIFASAADVLVVIWSDTLLNHSRPSGLWNLRPFFAACMVLINIQILLNLLIIRVYMKSNG